MASEKDYLESIMGNAKKLLELANKHSMVFAINVDKRDLKKIDDELDNMVEAISDEVSESHIPLIKEAEKKGQPENAKELVKVLNDHLKSKKVTAFGGKSGMWGTSETLKTYKISKVTSNYADGNFLSLDVYLVGYDDSSPLIYTDPTFLKSLTDLINSTSAKNFIKSINYSEHGMQGKNFVNLDVTTKNMK